MTDLLLRLDSSYGTSDIVARFDDQTTIGQLADGLERAYDRVGSSPRSIHRQSRGDVHFARAAKISQVDLRNGDAIGLARDAGLRSVGGLNAAATLKVVAGPDAGRTFELRRGESTIGRSAKCDVPLSDNLASRRHALFRVSDIVEVSDAGSTNGVIVNDSLVDGVHRCRPGDRILIGDTVVVADLISSDHDAVDVVGNMVRFNRPPRIDRPHEPVKIKMPAFVGPEPKRRLPMASALAPLLMGGVMFSYMKYVANSNNAEMMLIMMGLSPIIAVASYYENKRSGRKDHAEKVAEYRALKADQMAKVADSYNEEITSRFRFAPSSDELLGYVNELSPRLWEREPEDPDFLNLRVGLGVVPAQIEVDIGQGGLRDERLALEAELSKFATLPPVPITIQGRGGAPIGLAGQGETAADLARSLAVQAAALHSPNELAIGAILSDAAAPQWEWLKWLPHADPSLSPIGRSLCSVGVDEGFELLAALNDLCASRSGDKPGGSNDDRIFVPHVFLVVDDEVGIERARFSALLERGASAGISLLWLTTDSRRAPKACGTLLTVNGEFVAIGSSTTGDRVDPLRFERVPQATAEATARALSAVIDDSADNSKAAEIPKIVSLIDLLGGLEVLDNSSAISERWQESEGSRTLRAPVGKYQGGVLTLDIRVDGPHGLVGGTTGAGKSEFLQALIAGLAATHSPERINFLLVDYKGGSAFGALTDQVDNDGRLHPGLRHTVGMITDLAPAMVERALESLRAELHRREHLLNDHKAKDLMEMEKRGIPGTPPSLLIIIDEFAALAKEVPAFVDGVVDIAQRGRSLGLHLLLATQKPGGVISANIQANTNLRVALRMASDDESSDVVDSPIAAHIDRATPGRGVVKRGHGDLEPFQSAYVGGVTTPSSEATLEFGVFGLGRVDWIDQPKPAKQAEGEIDLKRLVRLINRVADERGAGQPRRPWLDPLPTAVNLFDLPLPPSDEQIPIGLADAPAEQTRSVSCFIPDVDGSMLLYGRGGSGKTVALRTLATSFGRAKDRSPVHVYGLDFGSRGLDLLTPLPHVGSVVAGDDYEGVTALLKELRSQVADRARRFAAARSSTLTEFRRARNGEADLPRLVVLVDGYDNFTATYEKLDRGEWLETLPRLVADGRQVGIHFFLTGTRRSSFPTALASQVSKRLVFRMASDDDYHSVNADPKWFDDATPPGRGRLGKTEVQVALIGTDPSTAGEATELRRTGAALKGRSTVAPPVRVLPDQVFRSQLPATAANGSGWLLDEHFNVLGPPTDRTLLIIGPPRSGKTVALQAVHQALGTHGVAPPVFAADPARFGLDAQPLADLGDQLEAGLSGLIMIDNVERIAGMPFEMAFQTALSDRKLSLIVTADNAAARGYDPTMKTIRLDCLCLALMPSQDTDGDFFGGQLPRTSRQFPPGRGYTNLNGQLAVAHVAIAD